MYNKLINKYNFLWEIWILLILFKNFMFNVFNTLLILQFQYFEILYFKFFRMGLYVHIYFMKVASMEIICKFYSLQDFGYRYKFTFLWTQLKKWYLNIIFILSTK